MKKLIVFIFLVLGLDIFLLANSLSPNQFLSKSSDLLINLSANFLWTALAIVLLDRAIEMIRNREKSREWAQTKSIFLDWTVLVLNIFLFKVFKLVEGDVTTDDNYRQRLCKLKSFDDSDLLERFSKLPSFEQGELINSFTNLRRDLFEIASIFSNKIDDPSLHGELSALLIKTRHASEFIVLTPSSLIDFYNNGLVSHLKNVAIGTENFYEILKSNGATNSLII